MKLNEFCLKYKKSLDIEYSDKEILLLVSMQMGYNFVNATTPDIIYKAMAIRAFMERIEDWRANAIRSCINAFNDCKIYRLTKEWDNMIAIDDKKFLDRNTVAT